MGKFNKKIIKKIGQKRQCGKIEKERKWCGRIKMFGERCCGEKRIGTKRIMKKEMDREDSRGEGEKIGWRKMA